MKEQNVVIETDSITLAALLKWAGITGTGGEAKQLVNSGLVSVNGNITTQRGKRIFPGDDICINNQILLKVTK
jgi:ribosome-associated protein